MFQFLRTKLKISIPRSVLNVLGFFSVLSFTSLMFAATPVPGHPFTQVGDGIWAASGLTSYHTYTFPDASSTVYTSASLIAISQGGTGASATSTALNIITGLATKGDMIIHDGNIGRQLSTGANNTLLTASSTASTGIIWNALVLNPAGLNTQLQFNDVSFFGATSSLTFDQVASIFSINGLLSIFSRQSPAAPATTTLRVYSGSYAGRSVIEARANFGSSDDIQPAFFSNSVFAIGTGGTTALSVIGNTASSTGTISHVVSEPLGYMSDQVTANAASSTAGTFASTSCFLRGTQVGSNGFFFKSRNAFVTATSSGYIVFVGLTSGAGMNTVTNVNAAGSHIGFQFSTQRADRFWSFITRDGTNQTTFTTTVEFTLNNVYDLYIYSPAFPNNSVLYYRIDNLTSGASYEGSTTSTLPAGGTLLRPGYAIGNTNVTGARDIRTGFLYTESDK